ncbi:tetratricopeptide repeat protein, partial [Cyclobacteriaceae bacterium]|nr:tetratricopeptide repeat protein [Cyclobacteriaceae bacterium]
MKSLFFTLLTTFSFLVTSQETDSIYEVIYAEYELEHYKEIVSTHAEKMEQYSPLSIYYIGMSYYLLGNDDECINTMDVLLKKDNQFADAYYIKGNCYTFQIQSKKAISEFQKAIQIEPTN